MVFPTDFVAQTTEGGETTTGFETENTESSGDDHAFDFIEGGGDSFKDLHAFEGSGTTGSLVRDHSTDSAPENASWGTEVTGARFGGVGGRLFAQEGVILQFGTVEATSHVQLFSTDNDNLLSRKNLFSNNRS